MKIETLRHSLAHILATAIQEMYPKTKFGTGPAIENGFYYDFDFSKSKDGTLGKITTDDLEKIEKKMRELIRQDIKFKKKIVSKREAKEIFKDQPYKLEIINGLAGETVSVYQSGNFIDLCKGPHVNSAKEIPENSFKLTRIAGAYWKGKEKNPMLTRIYGLAFETKEDLEKFLKMEKEAQRRDHRIIGKKLDLFHIDKNIGPGLILWHPKGAILKRIIENYAIEEYLKNGYQLVNTPHIAKIELWKKSGHLDFYQESMFPQMHMAEITDEEKESYEIKPMNCPFHIAIYKQGIKSYKDLPIRYTELGTVYRYEKSGTLHGLTRSRGFTQDDAHIFCTPEQLETELTNVIKLTLNILSIFGFNEYSIYLSTKPEKHIGGPEIWEKAENALKYSLEKSKLKYEIEEGGGAFYGPKIDIGIKDSIGREWQCSTIQVDFNLPERFDVTYIDKKGKKQRPIMTHRALLGSLERFIGVFIEQTAGAFPVWVSPIQTIIIPIGSEHRKYAQEIGRKLQDSNIRIEIKDENETVSKKIREGEIQKIPYLIIIGDKELRANSIRIRKRGKGDIGEMKLEDFIETIKKDIDLKI